MTPFGVLKAFLRSIGFVWRNLRGLLFVGLIGLNLATLTISGVYAAMSGAVSAAGFTTVAAREAAAQAKKTAALAQQKRISRKIARDTRNKVTKRIGRQAARNSASVFAEAIPFIGIPVIAAALAYEIKDSCNTARDVTAMVAAFEAEEDPAQAQAKAEKQFDCIDVMGEAINAPDADAVWQAVLTSPKSAWDASSGYYDDLKTTDWSMRVNEAKKAIVDFITANFTPASWRDWWLDGEAD